MKNMTVGDRIVRDRMELLDSLKGKTDARSAAMREEILSRPTPRSIRNETWPPAKR